MLDDRNISMVFVRAALRSTARPRLRSKVLEQIGLTPDQVQSASARVTVKQYGELWRQLAAALDDEFLGQDSRRMKSGSFAMMCHAVIACKTLHRALERSVRFFNLLLDDIAGSIAVVGGEVCIALTSRGRDPGSQRFAHELYLMLLQGILSWAIGRRIVLTSAYFSYPEPRYSTEYSRMYCSNLIFNADNTEIRFSESYLHLTVVQNAETLKEFLRTAPEPVLVKYKRNSHCVAQIHAQLNRRCAQRFPTLVEIARELNMTTATLRRRLNHDGTSYRRIKNAFRRKLALEFLKHQRMDLLDIALELGFSEASAFRRAFKQWTGAAPSSFRQQQVP
jgi:AraC-like DNA-binding protein